MASSCSKPKSREALVEGLSVDLDDGARLDVALRTGLFGKRFSVTLDDVPVVGSEWRPRRHVSTAAAAPTRQHARATRQWCC